MGEKERKKVGLAHASVIQSLQVGCVSWLKSLKESIISCENADQQQCPCLLQRQGWRRIISIKLFPANRFNCC